MADKSAIIIYSILSCTFIIIFEIVTCENENVINIDKKFTILCGLLVLKIFITPKKLFSGISRACEKTNFTSESIINFVDGIESQIIQDSNKDIKSSQIGELILKSLRKENEVAYIRYASVYRKFNGVKDFISTLESLKGASKNQLASIL